MSGRFGWGRECLPRPKVAPATAQPPAIPPGVRTKVLGEAPVEPDGSFFVRIPGDTAFYMELLDGQGKVLESMTRWIWVRKGTSRGCIGCHESRNAAVPSSS